MRIFILGLLLYCSFGFTSFVFAQETEEDLEDLFAEFEDEEVESSPFKYKGFLDARFGPRLVSAAENEFYSLGEIRGQFDLKYAKNDFQWSLVSDLKYSPLQSKAFEDIERGVGMLDIRELSIGKSLGSSFELKAGRQILTWGTGDLLFINDLFPKDWQAFLTGRPINYLKAPSNSVKISSYNKLFTVDLVYTPLFVSDRFVNGSIVEYYNPLSGGISGNSAILNPVDQNEWFKDGEWAIRLHKIAKGVEYDIYGYKGFWKTPEGFTEQGNFYFPELAVLGASVRTPLLGGVFNVEYGHYFSTERDDDEFAPIRNAEDRLLIGFEKEVVRNFSIGGQIYWEYINVFDQYAANFGDFAFREELRTLLSLRLEYLTLDQKWRFSFFNFYSPSDQDAYFKNSIFYKPKDDLQLELGTNIFTGKNDFSFFGQLETNSNAYLGMTWFFD